MKFIKKTSKLIFNLTLISIFLIPMFIIPNEVNAADNRTIIKRS